MIKEDYQMYITLIHFKLINNGYHNKFNYRLMNT